MAECSEIILKRTDTSDACLANTFSDQTDLSLNWCASCRAMKEAPRDALTHRHTCESQFPLCFLLVVQELKDVLNLLLEQARLRARCAALGCSCCGPQPEGWYLAPTHCCSGAAVRQEEAAKRANIPISAQSRAVNADGKCRVGIRASAKLCVHHKSRSQNTGLDFHHYKQQVQ